MLKRQAEMFAKATKVLYLNRVSATEQSAQGARATQQRGSFPFCHLHAFGQLNISAFFERKIRALPGHSAITEVLIIRIAVGMRCSLPAAASASDATIKSASPASIAASMPKTLQAVGRCRRVRSRSMTSSWRSEKL